MVSSRLSSAGIASAPAKLARSWNLAVLFTIFVILFGAVVRISGSGAGCGQHWPTCHGEVAHLPRSLETLIEQTHRLTSGMAMIWVFWLSYRSWRILPTGHVARRSALWSSALMITEALVGAGLVLLELVGHNDSVSRAVVMALHLLNTSALLFAMVGTAWAVRWQHLVSFRLFERASRLGVNKRGGERFWSDHSYWFGAALILIISAAGAVTALGDTVYPVEDRSSLEVARQLTSGGGHFLEHLRGVHPLLAVLSVTFWISAAVRFESRVGQGIVAAAALQIVAGVVNIYLFAPGWMQVLHLALANLLWLLWIVAWLGRHDSESAPSAA